MFHARKVLFHCGEFPLPELGVHVHVSPALDKASLFIKQSKRAISGSRLGGERVVNFSPVDIYCLPTALTSLPRHLSAGTAGHILVKDQA